MGAGVFILKLSALLAGISLVCVSDVIGLECWQCISDDCDGDPFNNYKAIKKVCQEGESCQKVEYRGRDAMTKTEYPSITRSCSQGPCIPHVDNCTDDLRSNPGCMTRRCCNDKNLCNRTQHIHSSPLLCWLVISSFVLFIFNGGLVVQ